MLLLVNHAEKQCAQRRQMMIYSPRVISHGTLRSSSHVGDKTRELHLSGWTKSRTRFKHGGDKKQPTEERKTLLPPQAVQYEQHRHRVVIPNVYILLCMRIHTTDYTTLVLRL